MNYELVGSALHGPLRRFSSIQGVCTQAAKVACTTNLQVKNNLGFFLRPEGPAQHSPGQRPGFEDIIKLTAMKGRHSFRESKSVTPLQG